jgi:DNA invertase Pin-like site-specific DNA recombinase
MIELGHVAKRAGWEVVRMYRDSGSLGEKGRGEYPELHRMMREAARREFAVLMAWSADRLARNLQDLADLLAALKHAGIDLYLKEPAVDTTTPSGRALFAMAPIFAEFERAMTRARVRGGIDRAREAGRLGRPKIDDQRAEAIRTTLASGVSIRKAARLHGVGISTVQRLKNANTASETSSLVRLPTGQPVRL